MAFAARSGGPTNSRGGARNPGVQPQLWNLIRAYSGRLNLDPYAVAAVARVEGGGRFGAVGDNGTSYGPFQLHVGGALPPGRNAAWANSSAGVLYAMQHMATVAGGLRGLQAVNAIVRRFERPAQPGPEVTSAFAGYKAFGGVPSGPAADTGNYKVFTPTDPHWLAQISRIQAQQTQQFAQAQQTLLQSLKTQAAQGRQSALSQSLASQLASRQGAFQQAQQGLSAAPAAAGGVPALGQYDTQKGMLDQIRLRALQRAGIYAV